MDQHKVKAPILLKIAVIFFTTVFIFSTATFLYLQFFWGEEVVIPASIHFLTDAMRGENGSFYFVIIPAIVAVCFIAWIILVKASRRERLLCELEQTVPSVGDIPMKSGPFQEVGIKGKFAPQRHPALEEVVTQTVQSPIVAVPHAASASPVKAIQPTKETRQEFTPSYLNQTEISTIRELKEQLAKEKLPIVSIFRGGNLSELSEGDKRRLEKIHEVNADRIFADIKQRNAEILAAEPANQAPSKDAKSPLQPTSPLKKAETEPTTSYLSADEIVMLHRKLQTQKKQQGKFVLSSESDEDKTADHIAKFYYESNLEGYDGGSREQS